MEDGGLLYDEQAVAEYVRELELSHSISAQLHVGVFRSDHATQTDVTEIWELKELRSVILTLTQSLETLKKESALEKKRLQAEHEQKIQQRASELHLRLNDRIRDIETVHRKKISSLRKSFQQQLADALAVIKASYEKYYNGVYGTQDSRSDPPEDSAKLQALQRTLDEKDLIIQSLEAQITQLEENEEPKQIIYQSEEDPEKERLMEENKEMRRDMDTLQDRVHQLEMVLKEKDKRIQTLDQDVGTMKVRMEEDQRTIEKLSFKQEELKTELAKEKSSSTALLQQQKEEMEKIMKSKLKEREKEQAQQHQREAQILEEVQKKQRQLMLEAEEVKKMKEEAEQLKRMKEKSKTLDIESMTTEKEKLQAQIKKLLTVREEDLRTIDRLQKELDRLNKTWEKKFEILKQSFHAIKDEMFLRQSLHRHAMSLPRVSVSYMADGGAVTVPTELPERNNFYLPSLPLPQIGSKLPSTVQRTEIPDDCLDTSEQDFYVENELQVVSDTEDDVEGVPPLPPPPPALTMKDHQEPGS